MFGRNRWTILIAVVGVAFLFARGAQAQTTLKVVPDIGPATEQLLTGDSIIAENVNWPFDSIRLRAFLVSANNSVVEVSAVASWSTTSDRLTSLGGGVFEIAPPCDARVTVSFGQLTTQFRVYSDGAVYEPQAPPTGPAVPENTLRTKIGEGLDRLEALGMPVAEFRSALSRVQIRDNASITSLLTGRRGALVGDQMGLFVQNALRFQGGIIFTNMRTVILHQDFCQQLANSQFFHENGSLTLAFSTAIHELSHEIIYDNSNLMLYNFYNDEPVVSKVEDVFGLVAQILRFFEDGLLADSERRRLATMIAQIRAIFRELHGEHEGILNSLLDAIRWQDADRNNLPDWLEQYLRDRGIDPDLVLPVIVSPPQPQ